jgi:hypothetical protein
MNLNLRMLPLVTSLILMTIPAHAAPRPKVGDLAPLFSGRDQDGKSVALADVIGKKIVLIYFWT